MGTLSHLKSAIMFGLAVMMVSAAGYAGELSSPVAQCMALASDPWDLRFEKTGQKIRLIEYEKAVPACRSALELEPDNQDIRHGLARALIAQSFQQTNTISTEGVKIEWNLANAGYVPAMTGLYYLYQYGWSIKKAKGILPEWYKRKDEKAVNGFMWEAARKDYDKAFLFVSERVISETIQPSNQFTEKQERIFDFVLNFLTEKIGYGDPHAMWLLYNSIWHAERRRDEINKDVVKKISALNYDVHDLLMQAAERDYMPAVVMLYLNASDEGEEEKWLQKAYENGSEVGIVEYVQHLHGRGEDYSQALVKIKDKKLKYLLQESIKEYENSEKTRKDIINFGKKSLQISLMPLKPFVW